jgi:hypothetical protein
MPKFVEGFVDKLQVPAGAKDVQVFDDEQPGFGIRKFYSGKASYFVKFNVGAQQRRKTLGAVVKGNLRAMRQEASAVLAKARLGIVIVGESWRACLDDDYGRIVRLLLLTGQRRQKIGDLAWSEMPEGKRQIGLPEHRTKNKRPRIVLLSERPPLRK